YNSQNKTKEALLYEAHTLKKLAYLNNKSFGDIDKIKLQRIYDIYNLMGLTSSNIDFDNFIFDYNEIYLTKKEKDFIKNTKIQASVSKNWRPFIFINENDRPSGVSLDYWELITKKVGLETSYNFFDTFSNQLKSIKNKTNDVIFSTGKTSNREDYSIFSKEYIKFPLSIATLKDEDFIEDGSFLLGKVIAVGNNFTAHKMLKDAYPNMNFLLVDSIKEGLELVDKKVAYAYVDIKPTLVYNINKEDFKNIKVTGNTGLEFALRVMIRDDYPLLKSILDKSIDTITDEETNHIIQKFNNIHFEKNYDYTKVLEILVLIMIVALFILYRQFLLRKTNNKLQETVDKKTKELKKLNSNLEKRINDAIAENSKKDTILFSQSKMAAMGEMIGNIAHQWRQPLSVISTTASGIQLKIEYDIFKKEDAIKELDSLVDATQYLSQTIDDFQDFLKPTKKSEQFNIKDIIYKHVDMFGKSFINNNIEFVLNCEDTFVVGNQNELLQVIINILNNSKDILKDKKQDNKYIFIDLYNEKNNAILSIKDNAGGIPKDILPKIFDPYFTTKHKSKGTGIGLYMSYQIIVNTFKAEITAINTDYKYNSTSQKGAIFTIKIPNK
ncbi:MAG: transporter substrate-binding domain-containing protein, partial [Campylobacterota bacterium]|nr:transporter substrate-binding domain-containing protein [Campylobacterota bacterium]